jgi:hypothetical protein
MVLVSFSTAADDEVAHNMVQPCMRGLVTLLLCFLSCLGDSAAAVYILQVMLWELMQQQRCPASLVSDTCLWDSDAVDTQSSHNAECDSATLQCSLRGACGRSPCAYYYTVSHLFAGNISSTCIHCHLHSCTAIYALPRFVRIGQDRYNALTCRVDCLAVSAVSLIIIIIIKLPDQAIASTPSAPRPPPVSLMSERVTR